MAKPSSLPIWATTSAQTTEPSSGKKAEGWLRGYRAVADWLNWWMNLVYNWVDWTDKTIGDLAPSWSCYAFGGTSFIPAAHAFGADVFVVVGSAGQLRSSPDGRTWTSRTSQFGASAISKILFQESKFVAVGAAGKISTSTDGLTWTSRTSGTANALTSLWYVNGYFMTEDGTGNLFYSADGETWTTVSTGLGTTVAQIVYSSGIGYLAHAGGTDAAFSAALASFAVNATGATTAIVMAAASATKFVIASGGATANVRYSTDGTSWSNATHQLGAVALYRVVYGTDRFVVVDGSSQDIAYSTDGATWTKTANALSGTTSLLTFNTVSAEFVAPSSSGVDVSADGITWRALSHQLGAVTVEYFYTSNGYSFCVSSSGFSVSNDDLAFSRRFSPSVAPLISTFDADKGVVYGAGRYVMLDASNTATVSG